MLRVAGVLDEAGAGHAGFTMSDIGVLVAAAAARLVVPAPDGSRTLALSARAAENWAQSVRSLHAGNIPIWVSELPGYAADAEVPLQGAITDRSALDMQADRAFALSPSEDSGRLLARFGVLSIAHANDT
jgi:hypothetical protein